MIVFLISKVTIQFISAYFLVLNFLYVCVLKCLCILKCTNDPNVLFFSLFYYTFIWCEILLFLLIFSSLSLPLPASLYSFAFFWIQSRTWSYSGRSSCLPPVVQTMAWRSEETCWPLCTEPGSGPPLVRGPLRPCFPMEVAWLRSSGPRASWVPTSTHSLFYVSCILKDLSVSSLACLEVFQMPLFF